MGNGMLKKRYLELDFARAIAVIAVIMIHAASFYPWYNKSFSWDGYYVYHQVTSFAVPAFILLSGLLLTLTSKGKPFNYTSFLSRRLAYIFIPYCAWSLIYFAYRWPDLTKDIVINDFLTGRPFFHLYFIAIILQLYVLFPLFRWASARFKPAHIAIALIAQLAIIELSRNNIPWLFYKLGPTLFVHWVFVFYIGCAIGSNYEEFKSLCEKYISAVVGVLAALTVYKLGDYYYIVHYVKTAQFWGYAQVQTLSNIPYTIGVVALCVFIGQRITSQLSQRIISLIAVYSFGIYLCHMLFLRWLKIPFEHYSIASSNISVFLVLAASLAASIILTICIKSLPLGRFIVGK